MLLISRKFTILFLDKEPIVSFVVLLSCLKKRLTKDLGVTCVNININARLEQDPDSGQLLLNHGRDG